MPTGPTTTRSWREALAARGIGLLAISYRGYPGSTGSPSEAGLLTDGLAAFDWLSAQGSGAIVLLGQSLGSGVAVNTAAERPAAGVILVSAYLSVLSVAQAHYPYLPVALLIKDPFRSDLRIAEREAAEAVHPWPARRQSSRCPRARRCTGSLREPKRMLIYDAAGHNDIWDSDLTAETPLR